MKSLFALGLAALLSLGSSNAVNAGAPLPTTSSYSGIIGIGGDPGDQGRISIAITATGQYTLKGKIAGIGFKDKGEVAEDGSVTDDFVIKLLGGFIKIPVHLEFIVLPEGKQIEGFATFKFQGDSATLGFTLYKSARYTKDSPAPQAGRHVIVFNSNETGPVPGRGIATVNVSATGAVTISGVLADGAKISCGGNVSEDGVFPILNVLYGRNGFIAGFARFNNANDDDVVSWFRFTPKGEPIFGGQLSVDIHPYVAPEAGLPAINFGNQENTAPIVLSGGGLANPLVISVNLDERNKLTIVGENESKLQLQLNKKTGLISGTIKLELADSTKKRAVKLVLLQDSSIAQGFFVSPTPSAEAEIGLP